MTRAVRRSPNSVKRAALLAGAAVVAAVAPMPARWVEAAYSRAVYLSLQPSITRVSNLAPFALFDVLLAGAALIWLAALARDLRHASVARGVGSAAVRTVTWSAVAYLAFLLVWGLNYRRVPLVDTMAFDADAVTPQAARRFADLTVGRLNTLAAEAHRVGWRDATEIDTALQGGLAHVASDLGLAMPIVGRPKHTLLDPYFRRAGVEGMTDPYLLETLVVRDLLPFERPLVIAHEWSHLAGLADESAANFAGWLACVHGSAADQYSGWLFLYQELAAALSREERDVVAASLTAVPRADLAASRARVLHNVQPRVSAAAWRAYDSYLKSNRVEAGTRSYGEVVQLVLGTTFADGWTPQRR